MGADPWRAVSGVYKVGPKEVKKYYSKFDVAVRAEPE